MRTCRTCSRSFPATPAFFRRAKDCTGGISFECRECRSEYVRNYKRKHAERIAFQRREQYAADNGKAVKQREAKRIAKDPWRSKAQRMLAGMKERAVARNLPIDLKFFTVPVLTIWIANNQRCSCCGVEFDVRDRSVANRDRTQSVDRIIPELGYVRGNVAIICWRCNNLKRDATADELQAVVNWMRRASRNQSEVPDAA